MQGCGNDFVVINTIEQPLEPTPELIRQLANRHFGVGCDQVLLIGESNIEGVDFSYRIFNSDGGEVNNCGNGARCFARYVVEKGLTMKNPITVSTASTLLQLSIGEDNWVTVDMGVPVFDSIAIPLAIDSDDSKDPRATSDSAEVSLYRATADGTEFEFSALSLGNPHAVVVVQELRDLDIQTPARQIQALPLFPESVNVGFMQVASPQQIKLRVYERGAGETLACGSGACAAVVAGHLRGLLAADVSVTLPGGTLHIAWAGRDQPVLMSGPAEFVYEGEIEL